MPPEKLDLATKYKTAYCIPTWLRDEQIKRALVAVKGRLEVVPPHDKEIHVACFGPSLKKVWEELKDPKLTIISGSGAHKFLLERGIVPAYHADVDPRPHKIELLGTPDPRVQYLIASTCCPEYFAHLKKHLGDAFETNVRLWHVFDNSEEGVRLLPKGEWAVTGGSNIGLRQISLAAAMGYRTIHVYGMDGSVEEEGSHASAHPNGVPVQKMSEVEVNGRTFKTTPAYLECAKQTFHELDMLKAWDPKINVIFHGDGMVQEMAKTYTPKPVAQGVIPFVAYQKQPVISEEYLKLQRQLHEDNLAYGVGGGKYADTVKELCRKLDTKSVLDYGCGKGYLAKALDFPIWEYDPAIFGKSDEPRPADIVFCNDVLEHIEPDKIDFVLDDLRRVTQKVGYFVIHTGPAMKTLADGRNAHILQKPMIWWKGKLAAFFTVAKMFEVGPLVHAVVAPHSTRAGKKKAKLA